MSVLLGTDSKVGVNGLRRFGVLGVGRSSDGGGKVLNRHRQRGLAASLLASGLFLAACSGSQTTEELSVVDHPSFPCYQWWLSSSRMAGLAGVVPYASRFDSVGVITYDDLFDLTDSWTPDSDRDALLDQLQNQIPADDASYEEWEAWEISVILTIYEWVLPHLDAIESIVADSDELRDQDRDPLLNYVKSLVGWVEDQWALASPVLASNPRLDATTLGVINGTFEANRLYQAWRDVTEDSPFDTEAGIKDVSMNVCGPEVLGMGVEADK